MYRNNRSEWSPHSPHYDYVVYFYQSGRFDKYLRHQKNLLTGLSYGPISLYVSVASVLPLFINL